MVIGVVVDIYCFKCMVPFVTALCIESTEESMVLWCEGSVLLLKWALEYSGLINWLWVRYFKS